MNKDLNKKNIINKYNYYTLFWIFLISCIIGVVIESIWCLIVSKHLESRTALVIGYFNPIYGIGALILTFLYERLKNKNYIFIFIICMISGGIYEIFCSICQEFIFGSVSWYYDSDSLGIFNKRTSVIFCIFWGMLGLLWIKLLCPLIEKLIKTIPKKIGNILTLIITIFLFYDILLSGLALYRQKERRKNIPPTNFIQRFIDKTYTDEKLKKIYPNMTIKDK